MKIRNGFVSNSSSSSFVLLVNNKSFQKEDYCPYCKRGSSDFYFSTNNFLNAEGSYGENRCEQFTIETYIENKNNILEENSEWITKSTSDHIKRVISYLEKIKNKDNYIIYDIDISYHDPISASFLESFMQEKYKDIIFIIESESEKFKTVI